MVDETTPLNGNGTANGHSKKDWKVGASSPWMDRFWTVILGAAVGAAAALLITRNSVATTVVEEQVKGTYRPMCKTFGKARNVKVLQTSFGQPTEKWAEQECLHQPSLKNVDVNAYGAPDAILQTDLNTFALPNRPPIIGFGGAFTEASSLNFHSLSKEGQETVLQLLFGELGYTMGRVHINSCDFSVASYAYDEVDGDFDLANFSIQHDLDSGMMDFMVRAKQTLEERWDGDTLNLYASPWSPPAWMKAPTPDDFKNASHAATMTNSAQPTCLRDGVGSSSKYADAWARYFTKFLQSYQDEAGLEFFAVTIQNEPEFPAPWEACSYTPKTQAEFLRNHLGPELRKAFPNTKILIFDHNKDHAPVWIDSLLKHEDTAQYVNGTAIHWYAGGMDRLLDGAQGTPNMHRLMESIPEEHLILGSEACHCPYTGYGGGDMHVAWYRAERYAHTILADLAAGSQAWVEWNLILDSVGGPNHLGNLCDASLLAVPHRAVGSEGVNPTAGFEQHGHKFGQPVGNDRTKEELHALGFPGDLLDKGVVAQPIFYYMGHISRHVRPGSRPVPAYVEASQAFRVAAASNITGGGVNNLAREGIEITVWPCEGSTRQQFHLVDDKLKMMGHDWLGNPTKSCIRNNNDKDFLGVMTGTCNSTYGVTGAFQVVEQENDDTVQILVTNAKKANSCLIVKKLGNNGGANGPRSGSQVAIGDCNIGAASLWKMTSEGEIISSYFDGEDVCMTTGWPYLQIGSFDTPNSKDGKKTVVLLNEAGQDANYVLKDKDTVVMTGSIPAHSIQTVLID